MFVAGPDDRVRTTRTETVAAWRCTARSDTTRVSFVPALQHNDASRYSARRITIDMPFLRFSRLALLCVLIAGCMAPVLLMPSSSQVMWALLQPLVGFDPNAVNLFEQPVIKQRMTALLGEQYAPAMQLLRTANELKKEGPLFYLVSRYTPVPELADKAGLVWNSDTNQMAALLGKGDVSQIFAETVRTTIEARANEQVQKIVPKWPAELAPLAALAPVALQQPVTLQMPGDIAIEVPAPAAPAPQAPPVPETVPRAAPLPAPAIVPPLPGNTRAPITGPSSPLP